MNNASREEEEGRGSKAFLAYLDLGIRFALTVVVCTFGGYWLDTKLSTLPLFLIIGALLGTGSGFLTVYRAAFPSQKKSADG